MHVRKGFKEVPSIWHRGQHVQTGEHLPKGKKRGRGQPMSHHNKLGPRGTGGPRESPWTSEDNRKSQMEFGRTCVDNDNLGLSPKYCSLPGPVHMLYTPLLPAGCPQCGPTLSH